MDLIYCDFVCSAFNGIAFCAALFTVPLFLYYGLWVASYVTDRLKSRKRRRNQ